MLSRCCVVWDSLVSKGAYFVFLGRWGEERRGVRCDAVGCGAVRTYELKAAVLAE